MNRRFNTFSLQEAAQESPTLASLATRAEDAKARLHAIAPLIPAELRKSVAAGPAQDDSWCVLVESSAAAAKLRQLAPALLAQLRTRGWDVTNLRIKVRSHNTRMTGM